jgi:hypothetical protein
MLKTPGLAVIWIYLVIELDLTLAAISLLCTALYYYRDTVARLLLLRSLSPEEILPLSA